MSQCESSLTNTCSIIVSYSSLALTFNVETYYSSTRFLSAHQHFDIVIELIPTIL